MVLGSIPRSSILFCKIQIHWGRSMAFNFCLKWWVGWDEVVVFAPGTSASWPWRNCACSALRSAKLVLARNSATPDHDSTFRDCEFKNSLPFYGTIHLAINQELHRLVISKTDGRRPWACPSYIVFSKLFIAHIRWLSKCRMSRATPAAPRNGNGKL